MNRKERRKAGKKFEQQIVDSQNEQRAKTLRRQRFKEFPLHKKIIGYTVAPLFVLLWAIDRLLHVLLPLKSHPNLKDYFSDTANMKFTIARIVIFGIPVLITLLIIN